MRNKLFASAHGVISLYWYIAVLFSLFVAAAANGTLLASTTNPKLDNVEFAQKTRKLQIPFMANNGQVDERVQFYAKTFGGTVFVTRDGEIVYALPKTGKPEVRFQMSECRSVGANCIRPMGVLYKIQTTSIEYRASCILHDEQNIPYCTNCLLADLAKNTGQNNQGVAIKETLIGGRVQEITGNGKAVTKVSYFKGNDPSQWKSNISTYDVVSLGEVYDGIELKLKAYGNNVEKLFCVKPDANLEQILINLSGAKDLRVNDKGQLEAETGLGPVKFTKPVAYQEIDGKRVAVDVAYCIQEQEVRSQESEARGRRLEAGDKLAAEKRGWGEMGNI